ncbi:hypothetical protein ACFWP3_20880 [Streptomyces sp. NPDC058525]|uniref:hypothetical protein n=1 Tax=Streptomyces sp. NPDC058525 TaxID=3346538 RepID=UPI00365FB9D1
MAAYIDIMRAWMSGYHTWQTQTRRYTSAPPCGQDVEIVLTDRVVHRVAGGNATAATAFVTALTAALPEQRDPGGSARVTVTSLEQPQEAESRDFSGLLMLLFAAEEVRLQLKLKKRGITVIGRLDFRTTGGAAWYKYTDADGVEHNHRSKFRGPQPPLTYDPQRPGWASTDLVWGRVLFKICARSTDGLLLLLAGGALALMPLVPN